ncbi:MAG: M48 family metalloprotease [Gammaproteobacteria bacterium]|nr:M48 family metalloprotease [Gammaproteobacteria bacterium]
MYPQQHSFTPLTILLLLVTGLLLTACATNPVTGGSDFVLMSEDEEIRLGLKYSTEVLQEMPAYKNPALEELVQRIGKQLATHSHRPNLAYQFTIVDSTSVNAFALPGGYIFITRGMLAFLNSEAELAAVLGHEIGHVTARHSVRQQSTAAVTGILGAVVAASTGINGVDSLTDMAGTAIVRGYGREHELEADRLGAEYLAKSGYDPAAMLEVVGILKNQEAFEVATARQEGRDPNVYHGLFSTHPDNDARFREVINAARKFSTGTTTRVGRDSFLLRLDGITFGDNAREGIVSDNRFYHKDLNFSLTFPKDWRIDNQTQKIIATPGNKDGLIQMTIAEIKGRLSPRQFMEQQMQLDNPRQGKTFSTGGLQGYTAVANGETPYGLRRVRYAVVSRGGSAYIFAGTASDRKNSGKYDAAILATAKSLHGLTTAEKKLAAGKKLDIIRVTRGMTYASLARRSPINDYPEEQLRLLNDQYPTGEPEPSRLLKVVR